MDTMTALGTASFGAPCVEIHSRRDRSPAAGGRRCGLWQQLVVVDRQPHDRGRCDQLHEHDVYVYQLHDDHLVEPRSQVEPA
jgi:hypothetical protein